MASGPASRRADRGRRTPPRAADDSAEGIRLAALAALEHRRRTRRELELALRRKGFSPSAIAPVLDRLTEVGLIDDLEYARVYLVRRAASRPRGVSLLRAELLGKGIPAAVADKALAEWSQQADPVEAALKALKPWLARSARIAPEERRRRLWEFLARRGFSGDVIERVAARLGRAADSDDGR